jgi:membrane protease YdiL (CAAX protease family)
MDGFWLTTFCIQYYNYCIQYSKMPVNATSPASPPADVQRPLSLVEFVIGASIVIAHNVYHVFPNEVPILFVLGWISIRLRNGGWKNIGLRRPQSWPKTILIALAAAVLRLAVGEFVITPVGLHFWPPQHTAAVIEHAQHNPLHALLTLLLVWTFAAFGEELSYRGYLLTRAAEIGGGSAWAWTAALLATSVLFGYGHFYKGPAGVIDSGFAGLVLGSVYLLNRKNLWTCILTHGFIDTIAVVWAFFGW